jgi:dolichyl-phosphooligosaccharide-protein glycotransferase
MDEENGIDFQKIKNFFTNGRIFNKTTLVIVLVLVCMFFAVYYRAYTSWLPITDDWAKQSISNQVQNQAVNQIKAQYPNLPDSTLQERVQADVLKIKSEQKDQIVVATSQLSLYLKDKYKDDTGQTYLLEIDPYQHLRRAENIGKYGMMGEVIKDGFPYTYYQFAPIGKKIAPELHPYLIFYSYKILSVFSKVRMVVVAFWLPAALAALCVIPAFFIVKKYTGNFGGFIAGILVGIHQVFLARTPAGFSDTDVYAVLFPLYITWLFLEALETDKMWQRITFSAFAGILIGAFSFAWGAGWWYIFDIIIGTLLVYATYLFIKSIIRLRDSKPHINRLTNVGIVLGVFAIFSILSLPILGSDTLSSAINGPIMRTQTQSASISDYWPNIQTTVAELSPLALGGAIDQTGSKLIFFIALMGVTFALTRKNHVYLKMRDYIFLGCAGIFYLYMITDNAINQFGVVTYLGLLTLPWITGGVLSFFEKRDPESEPRIEYAILLGIWLLGSLFATTHGTRFLLLIVPAIGLSVGFGLGWAQKIITKYMTTLGSWAAPIACIMLFCLLAGQFQTANTIAKQEVPLIDDAWYSALTHIKTDSAPNAIINSWWDFGHWFAYVADRPVTVDGAGQEYHLAYWMGTVLLNSNENESVNTLRMLDCGSRESYLTLEQTSDPLTAVDLLKKIMMQTKDEARKTLSAEKAIPMSSIEKILDYTHCVPPENYLVTSEDMVSKAPVWAHFGAWDFKKSYTHVVAEGQPPSIIPSLQEKLNLSNEEATNWYDAVQSFSNEAQTNAWISPWPQYITQRWVACNAKNETLTCPLNQVIMQDSNGQIQIDDIIVDLRNESSSITSTSNYQGRTGKATLEPAHFVYFYNNTLNKKVSGAQIPMDVLIDVPGQRILISDPLLSESLFTKLFYLDGRYVSDHFEKFDDVMTVTGQRVIVWRVKW